MNRDELIWNYRESERLTSWPVYQTLTVNQVRRERARQNRLLDLYAAVLPAAPVSRCPICGVVLEYVFDLHGLEGMWWAKDGIVFTPAPAEPHHRVLLGAIDFHGREPLEAEPNGEVLPGPGVPFVVPRLLEIPGMIAVVSSLTLPKGDTAYLIAYFSPSPVDPFELHQPWARETLDIEGEDDESTWGMATDPWDFELQPWIDAGKLKWINPGDPDLVLQGGGSCPYLNLPGVRATQTINMGQLSLMELPDGEPFDPFD